MCQGCFDDEWEDSLLTPTQFLQALPPERREMMLRAGRLLEEESGCRAGEPFYWQGSRLHAAIDDDNYDDGPYIAPDDPNQDLTEAEQAWVDLTVPERSIVVAILHAYVIP